jgi:colicin import membrane protein
MEALIIQEAQQYSIEPNQAQEILANLPQIKSERDVLESQFNDVIKMDIDAVETQKKARELRLLIQKNRTQGILVWHKNAKDFFLRGGQFVDAIKRKEVKINERMEIDLEQIEKHALIQEQIRRDKIRAERIEKIQPYSEFVPLSIDLGAMSEDEFEKLLTGSKMQHEAKKEVERLAEIERQEQVNRQNKIQANRELLLPYSPWIVDFQNIDLLNCDVDSLIASAKSKKAEHEAEQKRIAQENERLKQEAEKKQKELLMQQKEAEKKILEEQRQKAELEAKLVAEQKARQEREAAILKAEKEEKARLEKLAKAPIKKQMSFWVDSFSIPSCAVNNETQKLIEEKFESFKSWAKTQVDNI